MFYKVIVRTPGLCIETTLIQRNGGGVGGGGGGGGEVEDGGWGGGGHKGRTMHSCTYLQYSRIPDAQVTSLTSWKWLGVTLT